MGRYIWQLRDEMELTYISKRGLTTTEALLNKGILWGEAPFTTALVHHGRIVFEKSHLERLRKTIDYLYGERREVLAHMSAAMREMGDQLSEHPYVYLRATLFELGSGELEFILWAVVRDMPTESLAMTLVQDAPCIHTPNYIKRSDYSFKFRNRNKLRRQGIDDAIYFDSQNRVLDSSTGNLFFVKGDKIIYSEYIPGVLEGVLRENLIECMNRKGHELEQRIILKDELPSFDEIWVSNAFVGLQRVSKLDEIEYKREYFDIIEEQLNKYCGDIWPRKN